MSEKNGLYAAKQPDMCRNTEKLYIILTKKVPFRFKIFLDSYIKNYKCIFNACIMYTFKIMHGNRPKTPLKVGL